ncbi:hypothetical protein DW888_13575 [Bacteroides nordii]|uniref:Uncharacterized protein n=1 Tax=Bacteroides nordii TaxID=291645 RepID=A0A413VKZ8_9BACE|nr:phage/plasmid replication protein [Bacteroides nordii]RHB34223.1 hypothetical protein DW888_13575 [Bacteroides nordii]
MYDKVKLWTARTRATPDVSKFLDRAKDQIDHDTGEVCTFGSLEGLKVSIYTGGISIIGSLAKYLYPNNIYPLDRHTTAQAVEKLSDNLHISLGDAKVTGLEFGTQFVMAHPVENYISKLGDMPKLLRYHFDVGTLYYKPKGKQQSKIFAFYDKKADAAAKCMTLPDGFNDANLLKYEMRINGRLPQQLGVPDVTAATLSEKPFYRLMVQRYQDSYFAISKNNQIKTDVMDEIKTVSDAFDVFVARLITQSDQTQIAGFLEELKEAKVFDDRKCYSRLKKKIQEVATKAGVTVSDELIKELDDEIKNIGAYT